MRPHRVAPWIRRTPLVVVAFVVRARSRARISLKLETAQDTGAFKLRGATNFVRATGDAALSRGVVTVSTGNHGRAVAHAARRVGARAVVCMSELVPANKREAIGALGAEIRIVGQSQDEAEMEARRLVTDEGLALVHPFDDPLVIAGQGTIGIEILEDRPEVGTVIAGLSGGGLISGIAVAVKAANPACTGGRGDDGARRRHVREPAGRTPGGGRGKPRRSRTASAAGSASTTGTRSR